MNILSRLRVEVTKRNIELHVLTLKILYSTAADLFMGTLTCPITVSTAAVTFKR